jgi:subtilisin family serine protease
VRRTRSAAVLAAAAVALSPLAASAAAPSVDGAVDTVDSAADSTAGGVLPSSWPAVPVTERLHPWLADTLAGADPTAPLRVMVSGETTAAATAAAGAVGLTVQQTWDAAGTVVAVGLPAQVSAVVGQPGVRYVEGETPIELTLSTAHTATRSAQALGAFAVGGSRVDGAGTTIAVIDSGIDGTHPMFTRDGRSTVVRNLKNVCTVLTAATDTCFQQDPTNDTDTNAVGGHGTHVAGIAGGVEVVASNGAELRGSAPGASLVGLSVGGGLSIINANAAMQWVVDHRAQPCRPADQQGGAPDPACPPIKVTNHSYGPAASSGGNTFNPNSPTVTLQRALVAQGVVPVWAAGNDGGNGSSALTNPPGMDPTPGVLMVGSYNDAGSGSRDNVMSTFSSRGRDGDPTTYPDLAAPGDRITSACRPYLAICMTGQDPVNGPGATDVGTFNTISGTSMAAPYVAGVVAQLFQADPALSPAAVEDVLEDTAHRFAPQGTSPGAYEPDPRNPDALTSFDKGHGLVDVFAALDRVLTPAPDPAKPQRGRSPRA